MFRLSLLFSSIFLVTILVFLDTTESYQTLRNNQLFRSVKLSSSISSDNSRLGKIDLLYDSGCPICKMEVDFLRKRDIDNRIRFTDLASPAYNPADHGNIEFETGMRKLHAVLPDKSVVTGVEVFRQTYEAIGLGWIVGVTSLPIIGQAADILYDFWAENRLRITGRGDMADILKQRAEDLRDAEIAECDVDGCAIEW